MASLLLPFLLLVPRAVALSLFHSLFEQKSSRPIAIHPCPHACQCSGQQPPSESFERVHRKGNLTQSPPQLNSPACGANSTGQAAPQRKSDRIDPPQGRRASRINKMFGLYVLEHNNPDNPACPVESLGVHSRRLAANSSYRRKPVSRRSD